MKQKLKDSKTNKVSVDVPDIDDLCRASPLFFGYRYLSKHLSCDVPGPHHLEMYRAVTDPATNKLYVWAAPRGHAKSTVMSLVVPLWWICNRYKRHIILVSDTAHQAEGFLAAIVTELEENDALKEEFGDTILPKKDAAGRPVSWRDREITTAGGVTCSAYGAGKAMRGIKRDEVRPDAAVVDDIENDESVQTKEQRDKREQWMLRTLMNIGGEEFDLYMVGTVIHYDSVLARKLEDPAWKAKKWEAEDEDGNPLWPEMWSRERLAQKRLEIGDIVYAAEYLNDPAALGAGIFKEEWVQYYEGSPEAENYPVFAGFDPAISKKETADYSALVKVALGDDMRIYTLEAFAERLSLREQMQMLIAKCHRVVKLAIESNAFQVVVAQELIEGSTLPVAEVHAQKDKITRAMELSAHVQNGKVLFDKHRHKELIQQMLAFPKGAHDDLVDALGYAVNMALEAASYSEPVVSKPAYANASYGEGSKY